MSRPREDGIVIGTLEPGPRNSIADVGVTVGHVTVERTGVTAVIPRSLPVPAGTAVLNGAGELTGSLEIREWGILETPVYLTSTHAVGRVYDGAVSVAMARDPRVGVPRAAGRRWPRGRGGDGRVRAGRSRCGRRDELLRLEGRNRLLEPVRRRPHCRRPPAHELRHARAAPGGRGP